MKWWTDCCDQLFPGFKTPRLWIAQQCRSLTPPPTSRRGRHIYASFLDRRQGRNKCSLRGGKLTEQKDPQFTSLCLKLRIYQQKGRANWRLAAEDKKGLCCVQYMIHVYFAYTLCIHCVYDTCVCCVYVVCMLPGQLSASLAVMLLLQEEQRVVEDTVREVNRWPLLCLASLSRASFSRCFRRSFSLFWTYTHMHRHTHTHTHTQMWCQTDQSSLYHNWSIRYMMPSHLYTDQSDHKVFTVSVSYWLSDNL